MSIGEEATLPLTWVVPVFVQIIHQIPDGAWRAVLEGAGRSLSAEPAAHTAAGTTSLLHTAALALVSPGGQV